MRFHFRPRLTYANVMATLGVFLGLGGGAYAVSTTLARNSVGSAQLRKGSGHRHQSLVDRRRATDREHSAQIFWATTMR
jgi:hypothetical protein